MASQQEQLLIETRLLQANVDVLCDNLEKLTAHFANHQDKEGQLRTDFALVQQSVISLRNHIQDHCNIIHKGTDREPSIREQLAIIRKEGQDREKRQNLILALLAIIFAAIQAYSSLK